VPSPELVEMLALVPADFADPEADYLAVRAMMAPFHGHPVPPHVSVEETVLGGVRSAWCDDTTTADGHRGRVAFHCHGGGLVSCRLDDYLFYGAMLSEQLGLRVVMPDYRLAPEHPYPAAHEDCLNAYRGLLASGVDPSRLIVTGDSCGGGLALSTLLSARDEGLAMPAGFVSLSGWFDFSVAQPVSEGRDPFLTAEWVRNRAADYAQGRIALDDPKISPAFAQLAGLPPLYLPVAQFDTVGQGAIALGINAIGAGVRVRLESWPDAVHGWQGLVSVGVPEAVAAFDATRSFIGSVLSPDRA
jgi:monoterpene epsilon-lactone hydrolase